MKVLIIEDEKPAAEKLIMFLQKYDPAIEVISILTSISESVEFLSKRADEIDLIFQDIQLNDGISFDIFKQVEVNTPIIFTTAYNEYALNAFEVNSIAYLLKPLSYSALEKSMQKIESLKQNLGKESNSSGIDLNALASLLSASQKSYKSRFMVKVRDHIKSVEANEIVVFYAEGRDVFLVTKENRRYIR